MIKYRLHRFQKQITQIILLVTSYWLLVTNCFAQPLSSTELIKNARQYDGKVVVYEGEVIGDIMLRQDFAWINVNDGENAIGIWLPASLVKETSYTGSYKSKGDVLEITGIFHRSCTEHGGDLDIHGQAIRKITSGRLVQERLNPGKRNLAIILLGILGLIWILSLLKRR